jgi:lysozyme family protein
MSAERQRGRSTIVVRNRNREHHMALSSYDKALHSVLAHEGGYTNHPSDPGGPTNFGITIGDYRRYVNAGATASDVRAMRAEEAKAIYRQRYWDAMRCDELSAGSTMPCSITV